MARPVFLVALLCLAACKQKGPSPEYERARDALGAAIEKTMDPSYSHPEFDEVESLLRQVPSSAEEYELAQELAGQIHAARERARPAEEIRRQLEREEEARRAQADKARAAREAARKEEVEKRTIVTETSPAAKARSGHMRDSSTALNRALGVTQAQRDMEARRRSAAEREMKKNAADRAKELRKIQWEEKQDEASRCSRRLSDCRSHCAHGINYSECVSDCRRMSGC